MGESCLVIAPAWVGDMVMAHALFQTLKQQMPDGTIDVVAPPTTLSLIELMPEVRQGFVLDVGHGQLNLKSRRQLGHDLRANAYTRCLVLPNSLKSALLPWFAKIPQRTGWLGEQRYGLLNDWRCLEHGRYPTMVARFCALAHQPGASLPTDLPPPRFEVTRDRALALCAEHAPNASDGRPIVVLCPGAAYGPAKRWPAASFAALAMLLHDAGAQVWLLGGPSECAITAAIQQQAKDVCVDWAGKTSLLDVASLLAMADAVVTNDSGLMHMACAISDLPVVALYGSSSPQFTPPLSKHATIMQQHLPCQPCFKRLCPLKDDLHMACLSMIKPEGVLAQLKQDVPSLSANMRGKLEDGTEI